MMFFTNWTAWAQDGLVQFEIVTPPVCVNNKGETVQFVKKLSQKAAFSAGMAKRNKKGVPTVYRFSYEKSPKALQIFIDFHECAHHQTGDLEKKPPHQNSFEYMMKESIADCVAAIRIKSDKINGKILMKEVLVELKKDMKNIGFPKSTIESRELNIVKCFEKDISLSTYIDNILHKRNLK